MDDIDIRVMLFEEYPLVLELWKICQLPFKPEGRDHPDRISKEMIEPPNQFLVAEKGGKVIGSILATHDGRKGWLNRLSVHPDHRNEGIARALVDEAEKWLKEQGIGIFACLIEGDNVGSMRAIERLGYKEFKGVSYFTKRLNPEI